MVPLEQRSLQQRIGRAGAAVACRCLVLLRPSFSLYRHQHYMKYL